MNRGPGLVEVIGKFGSRARSHPSLAFPSSAGYIAAVILAGDVGGTKTRLALYAHGGDPRSPVLEHRAPSRDFATFDALVLSFLHTAAAGGARVEIERAAFGIAGPVVDNRSETTNLPWSLDGAALGSLLDGADATLMNDLEATGWGVPLLRESELETLQPGTPAHGNRALIAAGTGLGEGIMVWSGAGWKPSSSGYSITSAPTGARCRNDQSLIHIFHSSPERS
mgnify:CR=1 FL=1